MTSSPLKVAIVTGATSGKSPFAETSAYVAHSRVEGIGRSTSTALSDAGWTVVVSGRRDEELKITASQCKGETLIVACDITKEEDVINLFKQTVEKFGQLDLVFNNAGQGVGGLLEDFSLKDWQATIDVNLTAPFLCTREAFRWMKKQPGGGRIINNGSTSAHVPRPYTAAYVSSKHGLTGLTKSASLDGRKYKISCTQIDIGNTDTPMGAVIAKGVPQAFGEVRSEPLMDVMDVARTVVYIASLPNDVTLLNLTLLPNYMPFVGRG